MLGLYGIAFLPQEIGLAFFAFDLHGSLTANLISEFKGVTDDDWRIFFAYTC